MNRIDVLKCEVNANLAELRRIIHDREDKILPHQELYEFYQNGELIMVGTMREIQRYTSYALGTLVGFGQPAYLKKNKDRNVNKLIKIGSDSK